MVIHLFFVDINEKSNQKTQNYYIEAFQHATDKNHYWHGVVTNQINLFVLWYMLIRSRKKHILLYRKKDITVIVSEGRG